MRFFSEATQYLWFRIVLGLLVIGLILLGGKARQAAIFALLGFLLANELCDLFKNFIPLARPCQDFPLMDVNGIGCSNNPGTASAHSANMAAAAFSFTYFLGWWGAPWVLVAFITGLSRMYVAAHYPSQVLFGWLVGAFSAFLLIATYRSHLAYRSRRTQVEDVAEA